MAERAGSAAPDLKAAVEEALRAPHAFGFFHLLRLVESLHREHPRIGTETRAADAPVRLGQEPHLVFAPATLAAADRRGPGGRLRLLVRFFGLFGPNGPLPLHLTEYVRDRERNEADPTMARFADVFHHRMLELFYRAWAVSNPAVSFDRPESDRFGAYVASLIGLGMPSLQDRDALPDLAKLHYAGHFVCQSRHPDGLEAMIRDFFRLPARIVELVGEWLRLPPSARCRLGMDPDTGTLGESAVIGAQVWSRDNRFRIVLGPLALADYERFLPRPEGESLRRLAALVRGYAGLELAWDAHLVLRRDEVPPMRLGGPTRLGWTTWLPRGPARGDADDLVLRASAHA